jgi:tRNA(fMet)-specific endonuclease VapC
MNAAGSVLPDTNIVIAHFRNDPHIIFRLRETPILYIPRIVLGELYYGAQRAQRRDAQLALIRDFLQTVTLLFPDR